MFFLMYVSKYIFLINLFCLNLFIRLLFISWFEFNQSNSFKMDIINVGNLRFLLFKNTVINEQLIYLKQLRKGTLYIHNMRTLDFYSFRLRTHIT